MRSPSRSASLGAVLLLTAALASSCSDLTREVTGPLEPSATAPGVDLAIATCEVVVAAELITCGAIGSGSNRPSFAVNLGSPYVQMRSANLVRTASQVSYDVTVQNLVSQWLGTPDGITTTGFRVFFHSGPTNGVTLGNADGRARFTANKQPYFQYDQKLDVMEVSAPRNWVFNLNGASGFSFTVAVRASLPDEGSLAAYSGPIVATVEMTASAELVVGGERQLEALLRDQSGAVITGPTIHWSSSNEGVATVDALGRVRGVGPGVAMITAASQGQSAAAEIIVGAPVDVLISTTGYPIINLGTLPGGSGSWGKGVNHFSQAVGWSHSSVGARGFVWQNGSKTVVGVLPGGSYSSPAGINEVGQVVGEADTFGGAARAFLWQNGAMTNLGTLPGGTYSRAAAINDDGQVVGTGDNSEGWPRALLWENGTVTDLGTLPGGAWCWAADINNLGQVVGLCSVFGAWRAFLWQNGVMTDLSTSIPGIYQGANSINDLGQVVISSEVNEELVRSYLWEDGDLREIGFLPGSTRTVAAGINDSGQIVGTAYRPEEFVPFLWEDGTLIELGYLPGGTNGDALAINNLGEVVGSSSGPQSPDRAVLWRIGNPALPPVAASP